MSVTIACLNWFIDLGVIFPIATVVIALALISDFPVTVACGGEFQGELSILRDLCSSHLINSGYILRQRQKRYGLSQYATPKMCDWQT